MIPNNINNKPVGYIDPNAPTTINCKDIGHFYAYIYKQGMDSRYNSGIYEVFATVKTDDNTLLRLDYKDSQTLMTKGDALNELQRIVEKYHLVSQNGLFLDIGVAQKEAYIYLKAEYTSGDVLEFRMPAESMIRAENYTEEILDIFSEYFAMPKKAVAVYNKDIAAGSENDEAEVEYTVCKSCGAKVKRQSFCEVCGTPLKD